VSQGRKKGQHLRWVAATALLTFALAVLLSMITQLLFGLVESIIAALLVLLALVFVGIVFDMIGIAATAADEVPLLAKAAKKVTGAREALYLVRNAGRVANFCNDVVGDIANIVSGVLAAFLVLRLAAAGVVAESPAVSIVVTGLISALTVGGKALGKTIAIERSTDILLVSAVILAKMEAVLPGRLFFGRQLPPRRR